MLPSPSTNNQYLQSSPLSIIVFINLTPCVPLSFKGEGEDVYERGFAPSNFPV